MQKFDRVFLFALSAIASFQHLTLTIAEDSPQVSKCVLPDINEISSIVIDMYCHPFREIAGGDIERFQIPRDHFEEVITPFRDNVVDDNPNCQPDLLPEIGTMLIKLKNGNVIRICWYDKGKNRMVFSISGRRYILRGPWIHRIGDDEALNVDGGFRALYVQLYGTDTAEGE